MSTGRLVLSLGLMLGLGLAGAHAQAPLEENRPEIRAGTQLTGLPGSENIIPADVSDEPIGADLIGIILVSSPSAIRTGVNTIGIQVDISEPEGVDLIPLLQPFLGRPISLKRLVEIRVAIINAYRKAGHGFAAVVVPEQEITSGSLQVIVSEFRLGEKRVEGAKRTPEDYILDNITVTNGGVIRTDELVDDLNWLNLNPYRNLVVVAEPGKKFGDTNLILQVEEQKPWIVYGGYDNHGIDENSRNRLYVGFNVADIPVTDHQLSYQFAFSPESFGRFRQPYSEFLDQAAYQSHDAVYFAPLPWRHKLQLRAAYIQSRANLVDPFVNDTASYILSAEYMVPFRIDSDTQAELYSLAEFKRTMRDIYAGGMPATDNKLDVAQASIGFRARRTDRFGETSLDIRGVYSPGNISSYDTDEAYFAFSGDPDASASYFYTYGTIERATPVVAGTVMTNSFSFQWADKALPSLEQLAVGGYSTVRGYQTSEAVGDSGVFLRNEFHVPLHRYKKDTGPDPIAYFDLFPFVDVGYAVDLAYRDSYTLVGTGVGTKINIGEHVSIDGDVGVALTNGPESQVGDVTGNINIVSRF